MVIHFPNSGVHGTETVVESVYWSDTVPSAKFAGKILPAGYFYKTDVKSEQGSAVYPEELLRKKHVPGELSFSELMESLKQPIYECPR